MQIKLIRQSILQFIVKTLELELKSTCSNQTDHISNSTHETYGKAKLPLSQRVATPPSRDEGKHEEKILLTPVIL